VQGVGRYGRLWSAPWYWRPLLLQEQTIEALQSCQSRRGKLRTSLSFASGAFIATGRPNCISESWFGYCFGCSQDYDVN